MECNSMAYDSRKGKEILKYLIAHGVHDMYHILKAVYFADQYHLERYGRQVNGNRFVALPYGPVPSEMYDFIKAARTGIVPGFDVVDHDVYCDEAPDLSWMSESDIEALDHAVDMVSKLDFGELKDKSHDDAYNSVGLNQTIPVESIVAGFENADLILEYLHR